MGATVPYNMSTTNVGQILPAERGPIRGKHPRHDEDERLGGRAWRNAFYEPDQFTTGSNCGVGGTDPWNWGSTICTTC